MGQQDSAVRRRLALLLVVPLVFATLGLVVSPSPAAAARQDRAEAMIAAALGYLGVPYRLGAEGPAALDCSGFVFRAFSDARQLKAVGGARMRAVGYLRWFERRGLVTTDATQAERGDLIVYADGEHVGIYLGRGEVVSALTTSGITVHRLHGINWGFTHVLKVDWSMGKKPVFPTGDAGGGDGEGDEEGGGADDGIVGRATGSLNLRTAPDPAAEIVDVVSRGADFSVIGADYSVTGSLWLNVTTSAGATGWIWSQFTQLPEGADVESLGDDEAAEAGESLGVATGSLNLRSEPDPAAEIVGWVSMGATFKILGGAHSSSGWLWLNVESETGVTGWVWSQWTEYPAEAVEGADPPADEGEADSDEGSGSEATDPAPNPASPAAAGTPGAGASSRTAGPSTLDPTDGPVEARQY